MSEELRPFSFTSLAFAARLYPLFLWALDETSLHGPQFFLLAFVRGSQQTNDTGRPACLHASARRALAAIGVSRNRIDVTIKGLERERRIERWDLASKADRQRRFGKEPGQNRALMLTRAGEKALDDFATNMRRVVALIVEKIGQEPTVLNAALISLEEHGETFGVASESVLLSLRSTSQNRRGRASRRRRRIPAPGPPS